ncbi:cyclase family protein [Kibdelosporangium persicum]|uniref:Kynurenine formamidase n=1 Tax=Kibdelosporangium persicum TaxID=2698649 RepID=A0ABX2F5J0_9PSEU|nr:cyclase family protein [Kibdelosporangium persicum]NRN66453.1 Kynurenine formamidase [Kibdelosporangium persicum]
MTDRDELPSNWGRWGDDDELGTLNLITDEVRERAAREVRTGRSVSLAVPIQPAPVFSGPFAPQTAEESPVRQIMAYTGSPAPAHADVMLFTNHHTLSTHLDALSHIVQDGQVYPGRPVGESVTMGGVVHGSTTAFAAGIVTRGVLLDLGADGPVPVDRAITSQDLDAAEERFGVRVESGDALVVRFGWMETRYRGNPMPGMAIDAARWMHDRGVSVYAGDLGDMYPQRPDVPSAMHGVALPRMGMPLIDAVDADELAAVCAELGRYSFMFVAAPPRIHGMTGVPVNPIAVF